MTICVLQLVSGEEILSEVNETSDKITLKKPFRLMFTPEGVGLGPYMPLSNQEEFEISKQHVIVLAEADQEIKNVYASKTSGLVVPPSNLKLTMD